MNPYGANTLIEQAYSPLEPRPKPQAQPRYPGTGTSEQATGGFVILHLAGPDASAAATGAADSTDEEGKPASEMSVRMLRLYVCVYVCT